MKQFVLTEGIPGLYGPRIYIEQTSESKSIHAVLARESIWGGHDNSYFHQETGTRWLGYEFSYLAGYEDRLGRALAALSFDGYAEADAKSIMEHFREKFHPPKCKTEHCMNDGDPEPSPNYIGLEGYCGLCRSSITNTSGT